MGKSIIYNNPSGDKALENVYKKLQKNIKSGDVPKNVGMPHLKVKKKVKGPNSVNA